MRFSAALALTFFSVVAFAQLAQVKPDAGSVLEQMKQPAAAPRPGADVLPRAPEPKPALGAPGLKVVVSGFRISGNTIYPESVLLDQIKEFVGKEQTIDGLNDAATKVRAYYRERGYFLVQAYLPQQEIKGNVVEIAVIEARLGKVALNIKDGTRTSESLLRGIVESHLREGEIITETGLETPLLLLNDLPNAIVTSEIKPSQTLGAADLTVHVSEAPGWIGGQVDIDNYGNRFTGAIRTGLSLNITNPLALGDQFSFRAFRTDDEMGFYRIAYVLPVGPWGTRVGASYSTFHYRLGRDFIDTQSHGVGGITTVYAFHPIYRTRGSNLIGQVAFERKELNDRVESGVPSILDRIISTAKIGVVGDFRDGMLGGGLNSFSYTLTEGNAVINQVLALGLDQDPVTGPKTAGRFSKQNYEFRRLQKLTGNSNLLLALQGQTASKNLMSAERFSLGGPSGVRAYPAGEALGDGGYILQLEYRYLVPGFKIAQGDVSLSAFWDQGWVRINKNALPPTGDPRNDANERNLSGYGFGASLGKESDYVVRLMAAWRNEGEAPQSDTAKRIPRVWAQAIKWF